MTFRIPKPLLGVVAALVVAGVAVGITLVVTGGGGSSPGSSTTSTGVETSGSTDSTTLSLSDVEDRVDTAFVNGAPDASISSIHCVTTDSSTEYRCSISYTVPDPSLSIEGARRSTSKTVYAQIDSAGNVRIQRIGP